jgi:hypothetical protein
MRILGLILSVILFVRCDSEVDLQNVKSTTLGPQKFEAPVFNDVPERVVVLNTPSIAYLSKINIGKKVIASMSLDRLEHHFDVFQEHCIDLGNIDPSVEALLKMKPDLVILNPYQMDKYKALKDKLKFFVMDEYNAKTIEESLSYYDWFSFLFKKTNVKSNELEALSALSRLNKSILKFDVYNETFYVPACNSIWGNSLKSYANFVCNDTENTKVSKERIKSLLGKTNVIVVVRNGNVPEMVESWLKELDVRGIEGLVYCNTEDFPFFEYFGANPGSIFASLLECCNTKSSNEIFKWYSI